jgi:hypothetical protein
MARCEGGYLCVVCGRDVEEITDSGLYLRYVLGEVEWENLDRAPERHIRCDPVLAQFIVDESFEPVGGAGAFSKADLDPEFVRAEEQRVTRGYLRLRELAMTNLHLAEYPLAGAIAGRQGGPTKGAAPTIRDQLP